MTTLRKSLCSFLPLLFAAPALADTFDATSRGRYSHTGAHTAGNLTAYAGQGAGTDRYRTYFVFDLATLSGPVGSGLLRLEFASVVGPDAGEAFSAYDVASNIDELSATQTNRADIYNDLATGVYYGTGAAFKANAGTIVEVPLEPDAIADINRAAGGRFAMGVFVETLRLSLGNEGVHFSLSGEPRVHQLVLDVAPPPIYTLALGPEVAAAVPPGSHTVEARLVDEAGVPNVGASIDFAVVAGPNTGLNASVVSDENGVARYSYDGAVAGADHILASFHDGTGEPLEAEVMAFWDADCNVNQVPDACDLACDGFGGDCAAFSACGGGADADANGVLDECSPPVITNAPPDCSQAVILPSILRRVDHRFHAIEVSGVTDPDGDPVQVTIEEVFQDEPVESFVHGGRRKADAVGLGIGLVKLRAESLVRGDGRVYHVGFSADDGRGASCDGAATVCVPRIGLRHSDRCVDQGPLFDSTDVKERKHPRRGWRWHGRH